MPKHITRNQANHPTIELPLRSASAKYLNEAVPLAGMFENNYNE